MSFRILVCRILLLAMLTGSTARPTFGRDRAEATLQRRHQNFLEQRSTILENLKYELGQISDWCDENGLPQAADEVRQLSLDLTSDDSVTWPPRLVALAIQPTLEQRERQWRMQVLKMRTDRAMELYSLARKALTNAGLPSLAYRLIQDVLRVNPDHVHARAILGQEKFLDPLRNEDSSYAGEWVSPYESLRRRGRIPHILHEQYGWMPRAHVVRYEQGMRPWKGGWHSRQKDEEIRRDFRHGWEVESEHFLVRTNVSLEDGVVLSRHLETYHQWLRQNFAAFFDTSAALKKRFQRASVRDRRRALPRTQMEVWYFATRDGYQRMVRGKVPPGIETNGLYWQPDKRCYFFRNTDYPSLDTLFHEATHQILDIPTRRARVTAARALARKARKARKPLQEWILGGQSNFWIIEGLACYFESFDVQDGLISVGRPDHIRIVAAQHRLLRDDFYIPLETFCGLGKDQFQHHANVRQLYSQASGVVHFLMHYEEGRYRDDLVRLLTSVYRPDSRNPELQVTLSNVTGVPFRELDRQYREHMEHLAQPSNAVLFSQ